MGRFNLAGLNTTKLEHICPVGFVIPDHPLDPRNEWFLNSSCAIGCISPVLSVKSWHSQYNIIKLVSWISVGALIFLLSTHVRALYKLHSMVACVVYFCCVLNITFLIASYYSIDELFCYDNSIPLSFTNGLTYCIFESCICAYAGGGITYAW